MFITANQLILRNDTMRIYISLYERHCHFDFYSEILYEIWWNCKYFHKDGLNYTLVAFISGTGHFPFKLCLLRAKITIIMIELTCIVFREW